MWRRGWDKFCQRLIYYSWLLWPRLYYRYYHPTLMEIWRAIMVELRYPICYGLTPFKQRYLSYKICKQSIIQHYVLTSVCGFYFYFMYSFFWLNLVPSYRFIITFWTKDYQQNWLAANSRSSACFGNCYNTSRKLKVMFYSYYSLRRQVQNKASQFKVLRHFRN